MRGTRAGVSALIAAVAAVILLGRPAGAVVSDAIAILPRAHVLVSSPACDGSAVRIAQLPPACFEPAKALKPRASTTFFHPTTHWYRFTVPPSATPGETWFLNVSTYVTDGELDVIAPGGRLVEREAFGSVVPVAERAVYAHELIVPVTAPDVQSDVLLLRITAPVEQPTTLEMRSASSYAAYSTRMTTEESLPLAFLNGIAVALGIYNLMLFVMLRRRLYLLYGCAILALVLYQLIETGAAWTTLWPHLSLRDDWPPYAAWVLYFALIVPFTREFLDLRRVAPVADAILLAALGLLVVESTAYVLVPDAIAVVGIYDILDPVMTAIIMGAMLLAGAFAWRAGVSAAPYYLLAFAGSAFGLIASDAGTFDLYPSSVTDAFILTSVGGAWEALFLALALGERVRDLERAAARYEEYAYIDPLTGIANRRSFDEAIEREWRRTLRMPGPISVIIFDIDHFKRYNDRFGHPAGDARLISVARTIAEAARRTGDLAARYGGEEFAMLLPGTSLEGAVALADAVRLSVRESGDANTRLTISAGCATAFPHSDTLDLAAPETLLAAADAALYIAKTSGRDRVAIPETEVV